MAAARANGSLAILTWDSCSPSGLIRTITERRRCKSIPTYSGFTGTFFRRGGVAFVSPSFSTLGPSRREEAPRLLTAGALAITVPPLRLLPGVTGQAHHIGPSRRS